MVRIFQEFLTLIAAFILNSGLIFVYFHEQGLTKELYYFLVIVLYSHNVKLNLSLQHRLLIINYEQVVMLQVINELCIVVHLILLVLIQCYFVFE